jgi:hypothetical protein
MLSPKTFGNPTYYYYCKEWNKPKESGMKWSKIHLRIELCMKLLREIILPSVMNSLYFILLTVQFISVLSYWAVENIGIGLDPGVIMLNQHGTNFDAPDAHFDKLCLFIDPRAEKEVGITCVTDMNLKMEVRVTVGLAP